MNVARPKLWAIIFILCNTIFLLAGCNTTSNDFYDLPLTIDSFDIEDRIVDGEILIDYTTFSDVSELVTFYKNQMPPRGYQLSDESVAENSAQLTFQDSDLTITVDINVTTDPAEFHVALKAFANDKQ